MPGEATSTDHGAHDVYALIMSALQKAGKPTSGLTLEDLAPVDHFHARGFPATIELGDRLPIASGRHLLDIGCGLGGPARYFAKRFNCKVSGVDITPGFVEAANKLTTLLVMEERCPRSACISCWVRPLRRNCATLPETSRNAAPFR